MVNIKPDAEVTPRGARMIAESFAPHEKKLALIDGEEEVPISLTTAELEAAIERGVGTYWDVIDGVIYPYSIDIVLRNLSNRGVNDVFADFTARC
jgi:hypothetical protein